MRRAALGVVAGLAALALGAQLQGGRGQAQPAATAQAWTVDPVASSIGFVGVMADSGAPFQGRFQTWDAQIRFDPADLAGSHVRVAIRTRSVHTDFGDAQAVLPGPVWLAVDAFPEAVFESRTFTSLGGGRYEAAGELTLRGVRAEAVLPFTLAIDGDEARVEGGLTLDRNRFGVGQGEYEAEDFVARKVEVRIAVSARRAAG